MDRLRLAELPALIHRAAEKCAEQRAVGYLRASAIDDIAASDLLDLVYELLDHHPDEGK